MPWVGPSTHQICTPNNNSRVGSAMGVDLPVTAKALECYDGAAQAGWGNRDASNVVVHRLEKAKAARR